MKFLILILFLLFTFKVTQATTYFVRTDGDSSCNGLIDAPFTSGTSCSKDTSSLQTLINSTTSCGDTIKLKAGQTFTFNSTIIIPNRGCTNGNPITITSTNIDLIANKRVSAADAINMPKIRGTNLSFLFSSVTNITYWTFDGLEVTDNNSSTVTINLFDFGSNGGTPDHIIVQRCFIHQKEYPNTTTTDAGWVRYVKRAIQYEGSNLLFKWNYCPRFEGYLPGGGFVLDTWNIILSVGGPGPLDIIDNFLEAEYATIFTGGGGGQGKWSATSSNATLSGATISDASHLINGTYIAIVFSMNGSFDGNNIFTRTSGETINSSSLTGPFGRGAQLINNTSGTVYNSGLTAASGDNYTVTNQQSAPNGANYTLKTYFAVRVDSINGNIITYTPIGNDALVQVPVNQVTFIWANDYDVGGNILDITIKQNTISSPAVFGLYAWNNHHQSPKGYWEFKTGKNVLVDGNIFTGLATVIAMNNFSQEGRSPWITSSNITFRNNTYSPTDFPSGAGGQFFNFQPNDPYHTSVEGSGFYIYNNLLKLGTGETFLQTFGGKDWQIYHNTIANDRVGLSYHAFIEVHGVISGGFVLRDNIAGYRNYGLLCNVGGSVFFTDCISGSRTVSNNVVVDTENAGVNNNTWGTASILSPIITGFGAVGFTNGSIGNYILQSSSPFHNAASDGTDVGFNQNVLEAAQGSLVQNKCNWHVKCN